jgi:hypothetical protein
LLCGGFALASTLWVAHASYSPGTVGDLWYFVETIRRFMEGEGNLAELFLPFGGHRLFVPKLLYLADYLLFDGRNILPLSVSWLLQGSIAALLIVAVWRSRGELGASAARFLVGLTLALLFSSTQIENFVSAWHVHWFLANAAMCLSFGALAASPRAGTRAESTAGVLWFFASLLAAWVATISMANGLLCWPILLLLGGGMRLPRRRLAWIVVASFAALIAFFVDYLPTADGDSSLLVGAPLPMLTWFLLCVGAPLSWSHELAGGVLAGIGIAVASFFTVTSMVRRRGVGRNEWVLLGVMLFSLGSVAMITAGRAAPWPTTWAGPRYQTVVLLFWLSLGALALLRQRGSPAMQLAVMAISLSLVAGAVLPAHSKEGREAVALTQRIHWANRAIVVGIRARRSYAVVLTPHLINAESDIVQRHRAFLQARGLAMFSTEEARRIGSRVAAGSAPCDGDLGPAHALGNPTRGYRAVGRLPDTETKGIRSIFVTDGSRTIIGLGGKESQSIHRASFPVWAAYFMDSQDGRVDFWAELADGSICRLAPSVHLNPERR